MGGRGSKGRARHHAPMPKDPILPPDATFRPDQDEAPPPPDTPTEQGERRPRVGDPAKFSPDVRPPADPGPVPTSPAEIDAHVVETARSFEQRDGDYVNLANVRAAVHPDLDREQVDAALQRLNRQQGVIFSPDDDQEAMSDTERGAAVRIGIQDQHLVCFDNYTPPAPDTDTGGGEQHTSSTSAPGARVDPRTGGQTGGIGQINATHVTVLDAHNGPVHITHPHTGDAPPPAQNTTERADRARDERDRARERREHARDRRERARDRRGRDQSGGDHITVITGDEGTTVRRRGGSTDRGETHQ